MTAFTEEEQLYCDLDWYAIDRNGRIGQFSTAGHRLLPPSFASNKEMTEKLSEYFESLMFEKDNYIICPDLKMSDLSYKGTKVSTETGALIDVTEDMRNKLIDDWLEKSDEVSHFGIRMASRGLYSYDSNTMSHQDYKTYYRFALPKKGLRFNDLPQGIKIILDGLRMPMVSFVECSLISEKITENL